MGYPMNYNQDGRQKDCRLSFDTCGHSNIVIYILHISLSYSRLSSNIGMSNESYSKWLTNWPPPPVRLYLLKL